MNPKFNMLIRFTLEIFLVFVVVASFGAKSASTPRPADEAPSETPADGPPGSSLYLARVEIRAEGAQVRVVGSDGKQRAYEGASSLLGAGGERPDHLVVRLSAGAACETLLAEAAASGVPVTLEWSRR